MKKQIWIANSTWSTMVGKNSACKNLYITMDGVPYETYLHFFPFFWRRVLNCSF